MKWVYNSIVKTQHRITTNYGEDSMNEKEFINEMAEHIIRDETSLFLGAGSSCSVGFPSWGKLLEECTHKLNIKITKDTDLFSIAQYFSNRYGKTELQKIVKSVLNKKFEFESKLLNSIMDLNFKNIWTTNYDSVIEDNLSRRRIISNKIIRDSDLVSLVPQTDINIYKLNGDVSDSDNIVITKADIEKYNDNHQLLLTFFKKELISNTFLFLGYSFSDTIVLSCLSFISTYLNNKNNFHYTIIEKKNTCQHKLFIKDLEKRYHIKVLQVKSNDEIPNILDRLVNKIRSYRIFISGSFINLNDDDDKFANELSKELTYRLLEKYQIYSGMGYKLGNYISGYGLNYLFEEHFTNIEHHLIMRPFAEHMSEQQIHNHRENLIDQCQFVIFLFGDSKHRNENHNSIGVWNEYHIAKKNRKVIIPIGSSGFESRKIYNDVLNNITQYPYLEKYINILGESRDATRITDIILRIIAEYNSHL